MEWLQQKHTLGPQTEPIAMTRRVVVDDISMLRRPAFLGVADPSVIVTTTSEALESAKEIAMRQRMDVGLVALLESAIQTGHLRVADVSAASSEILLSAAGQLRSAEAATLNAALKLRSEHPADDLWVSLQSDMACRVGIMLGLRASPPNVMIAAIKDAASDSELAHRARQVRQYQLTHRMTAVAILLGAVVVLLTFLAQYDRPLSARSAIAYGATLPVVAAGMYWLRTHQRLQYGVAEVVFGLLLASIALVGGSARFTFGVILQLAAAGYIMVRGLDNIGQSEKPARLAGIWKRLFTERLG